MMKRAEFNERTPYGSETVVAEFIPGNSYFMLFGTGEPTEWRYRRTVQIAGRAFIEVEDVGNADFEKYVGLFAATDLRAILVSSPDDSGD